MEAAADSTEIRMSQAKENFLNEFERLNERLLLLQNRIWDSLFGMHESNFQLTLFVTGSNLIKALKIE